MITNKDEEVGFEEVTRGKAILGGYSDKALLIEEGERGGFRVKGKPPLGGGHGAHTHTGNPDNTKLD